MLEKILENFGFDWRLALANLINFLIIVWLLKKFAFKPIRKILDERENKIKKGIEDAEKSAQELQLTKQTSEKTLLNARNEANEIIARANKESEKIIAEGAVVAEQKTKEIINLAKQAVEQEKQKMMAEIKGEVVELVIDVSEKIIKQKTIGNEKELIEKLLE